MISNLLFLSCTGTRGRELVHLEQGTGKVACIVGQPVHQHGEREHDAGEDVHDREAPSHGLLHLVRGSLHRSLGEVLAHVVELHVPHACAHQQDEEADDDLSGIVGRTEGIGDADTEDAGLRELLGSRLIECAKRSPLAGRDIRNGGKHVEHAHEHRTLNDGGPTRPHGVGVIVLVELHHLTAHGLFAGLILFALVLVLNMLHLGLQGLHLTHRLHLLEINRQNTGVHHEHKEHDRQHPRDADRCHAQQGEELMEQDHDLGHEPLKWGQQLIQPAPNASVKKKFSGSVHQAISLIIGHWCESRLLICLRPAKSVAQ